MTALTARAPLHHLSMNTTQRPARRLSARLTEKDKTNGAKKRKMEYDEEIEGFAFTRARSKKPRDSVNAKAPPQPAVILQEKQTKEEPVVIAEPVNGVIVPEKKKKRNKMSFSTPKTAVEERPIARRRSKRLSGETEDSCEREKSPKLKPRKRPKDNPKMRDSTAEVEGSRDVRKEESPSREDEYSATKIALPFADTPIIRRNKAMREGKADRDERRSSLGMRGRRASSLIESGTSNALPHSEVDIEDFYKHIESSGLSEPRRMRQLLTWCATRAMGEKRSGAEFEDQSTRLAARVIQEELLTDLSNRSELSDWFAREDVPPVEIPVVHKPNPKNVQNIAKIEELEEQIKRLQSERKALESLLRPPSIPSLSDVKSTTANNDTTTQTPWNETAIDASLLDSSDLRILESFNSKSSTSVSNSTLSTRINSITASIRPTVEMFADSVHQMSVYRDAADQVAGTALGLCAQRLEERDQRRTFDRLSGNSDGGTKGKRREGDDIGRLLRGLSRVDR